MVLPKKARPSGLKASLKIYKKNIYLEEAIMPISESQIFVALFIALINGFLALRLGSTLYRN